MGMRIGDVKDIGFEKLRIEYKTRKSFEENRKALAKSLQQGISKLEKEKRMLEALYHDKELPSKWLKELIKDINQIKAKIYQTSGYMQVFFQKEREYYQIPNSARNAMKDALERVNRANA